MADTLARLAAALDGRYRIINELGRGGMATVYLAEDLKHHRSVAIKVLREELSAAIGASRFLQEIELTAGLQHPHILPLFDSGETEGLLFYVMPFVEGESLRDRLQREQRLPLADALAIGADVAAALTWAHARGVIHRDIKPENILLAGGEALVADFGIALALTPADGTRLTGTGLSLGTPAYMSPEQIAGDKQIDGRSDVYALACVLFEMITGEPPFIGTSAQSVIAQALVEPPRHARSLRVDVPAQTDAALMRALSKDPATRFATAREFIDACAPPAVVAPPRTQWVFAGAAIAVVIVAAVAWPLWKGAQVARARALLPVAEDLLAKGRHAEAYDVALRAERWMGSDSALTRVMETVSDLLTITTEPAGARVYLQRIPESGEKVSDSVHLGVTPLVAHRLARAEYRVSVRKDGFAPLERLVSSGMVRTGRRRTDDRAVKLALSLHVADSAAGMVAIPGGHYSIVSPDLPIGLATELRPYALDRFEVTTDAYRQFVRSGGYTNKRFWRTPVSHLRFVDRTGLGAPRDWVNQEPAAGKGSHPVTGISWYEADAFCAAQGKRLPTMYEWEKAARNGIASPTGIIMPWGFTSAAAHTERRANFGGTGTVPVDAHPFGISPYGAHAMAGNVKEWLSNASPEGFTVIGGSWQDPAYLFSELGALPGETATAAIGFRCARSASAGGGNQGDGLVRIDPPLTVYRPVDAATIRTLRGFYRYDRLPANARVTQTVRTPDWRRERIWIDGVGGDSILAYLYLPTRAEPPYQTLVQVPSSGAFFFDPVWKSAEDDLGPHIKAGRAVLAPVFKGMIERPFAPGWQPPPSASVGFRDLMVRHATELRMSLDYLETRSEIDATRLAYIGLSWGAGSRLTFAAVDARFRAIVFIGAGIDERIQPTLPEASNVNFAPYISAPKLVVNGRQDEEHPWLTRARPLWNLLREPKELVLIDGAGHHPPLEMRVPPINAFLDRTLGLVVPARVQ